MTKKLICAVVLLAAATVVAAAGTAGADPDTSTITGLRHSRSGRADRRRSEKLAANLRRAAAGVRRELVTRHWKLGIPAGNRVALCGGDGCTRCSSGRGTDPGFARSAGQDDQPSELAGEARLPARRHSIAARHQRSAGPHRTLRRPLLGWGHAGISTPSPSPLSTIRPATLSPRGGPNPFYWNG